MGDLLVKGGEIITLDSESRVLRDYGVSIKDGLIEAIAPEDQFHEHEFGDVIHAGGRVITPGWINTHMHFYSSFATGLGKAEPASDFTGVLENLWWRLDKKLTLKDCYFSALIALIQCIRQGTTTIIDHHASPGAVSGSLQSVASAVKESGLRASLCYEVSDRDGPQTARMGLEENAAFIETVTKEEDPQLKALFGLHAAFTIGDDTMKAAVEAANRLGVGFHIHTAEDRADQEQSLEKHGARVVQRLYGMGVLGSQTICAHCVHLDSKELALLAKTNTIATHQPQSNLNNAVGVMNLPEFLNAGILTGLGTDAMTSNMLEELRSCLWIRKWTDRTPSGGFNEAVQLLTRNNPSIAGRFWENGPGVLEVGRPADLLIYDYQPYTPLDAANAAGHLVFGLSQSRVNTTVARGQVLMRDGVLTRLDEVAVMAEARERAAMLWERF